MIFYYLPPAMQHTYFFMISFAVVVYCCIVGWHTKAKQGENSTPKVVITKPSANDRFNWNSLIPYAITVTDKEDGNSEYNEIAANEVFLKIVYLPDSANVKTYLAAEAKKREPAGLTLMKTSTCFNCHAVKSKLIGPAFEAITKKYPHNSNSVAMLANKVIAGSSSVWGSEKMPPHSDIEKNKATEIISWIMNNCSNANVDYLPGVEGVFRTRNKPEKNGSKGVYISTASYTDHGLTKMPQQHKEGRNTAVLRGQAVH